MEECEEGGLSRVTNLWNADSRWGERERKYGKAQGVKVRGEVNLDQGILTMMRFWQQWKH